MKRTIAIVIILILAALIGFLYLGVEEKVLESTHPTEYKELVEKYSEMYSVPKEIVYAVIKTESSFKSDAVSNKGAIGLMQITPDTYAWLCTKESFENNSADMLYNPEINIKAGTLFLSLLYTEFGIWENVYAAYNAGRTRVAGWLEIDEYNDNGRLVNIPYAETASYVEKVSKAAEIYTQLYSDK